MAPPRHVQCLLWDFGDTLCDELSLWRVSPEWMKVYRSFDDGLGAACNLGELDTRGFVAELAKRMPLTEAGYLYTTDSAFRRDVAGGIDGLLGR